MVDANRGNETENRPVWSDALLESLARAIHDEYVRAERARAQSVVMNPSTAPWEELPEALRESSRCQAADILDKLDAIDCDVRPTRGAVGEESRLEPDEVEFLAELEHRRWVDERRRNGWVLGPRDSLMKTTPYLMPWEELPEEMREYDRMFVRLIPDLLRAQGYRIIRRRC